MTWKIEDVVKMAKDASEERLNNAISKGALHLSDEQVDTVSFVFWLCYLAERDLEAVIKNPLAQLEKTTLPEILAETKRKINELAFGKNESLSLEDCLKDISPEVAEKIRATIKERYQEKRTVNIDNLLYFADKIKLYEGLFGHNNVASVLWKINDVRKDLSHLRVDELTYEGASFSLRNTKEKAFGDYLTAVGNPDTSKSPLKG